MSTNQEVHEMRAQILDLRSAGIVCATAIHRFPACGKPGGDHLQCPEARIAMRQIYDSLNELMVSVRMALTAVFHPVSEGWDFLWDLHENSPCPEHYMALFGREEYPDQDEFITCWGEMDAELMDQLGSGFSEDEWAVLNAKRAWQNGTRRRQVLELMKYLEDRIAEQFDLFESVVHGGLPGTCNLGQWAGEQNNAMA